MARYAGLGSRNTIPKHLSILTEFCYEMSRRGHVLYSGGAKGADTACEDGAKNWLLEQEQAGEILEPKPLIFLPWAFFEKNPSPLIVTESPALDSIQKIALEIEPDLRYRTQGVKKLKWRNVCQVLGWTLDEPVDCVVFCAPEYHGKVSGGTGFAVALARREGLPCYNLLNPHHYPLILHHEVPELSEPA